jgi:amidohydrolase
MLGTIRTFDAGVREELHAKLRKTVNLIAEASGASATVTIDPYAPVTGNDPELLQRMMPTLEWAAGEDKVVEHPLITGAEDFAHFERRIPGLYLMLGINKEGVGRGQAPSNHSPLFYVNEDALIVGVRTMVGLALDYAEATGQAM